MLALGWEEDVRTCPIHPINKFLDGWLRTSQKLEEGGDLWEEISTPL
jgi:hypothetical protein